MASRRGEGIKPAHSGHDGRTLTLSYEDGVWMEAESEDIDFGVEVEDSEAKQGNSEFDNLVARYFGDVRQFALLNRTQEKELWQGIEDAQTRLRRALCTSPVALATLTRLWHQVELEEIPLDQVFSDLTDEPRTPAGRVWVRPWSPCKNSPCSCASSGHAAVRHRVRPLNGGPCANRRLTYGKNGLRLGKTKNSTPMSTMR